MLCWLRKDCGNIDHHGVTVEECVQREGWINFPHNCDHFCNDLWIFFFPSHHNTYKNFIYLFFLCIFSYFGVYIYYLYYMTRRCWSYEWVSIRCFYFSLFNLFSWKQSSLKFYGYQNVLSYTIVKYEVEKKKWITHILFQ